jgi:hypothetical protein
MSELPSFYKISTLLCLVSFNAYPVAKALLNSRRINKLVSITAPIICWQVEVSLMVKAVGK